MRDNAPSDHCVAERFCFMGNEVPCDASKKSVSDGNKCDAQFTDPDGTEYSWDYSTTAASTATADTSLGLGNTVDHVIHVVQAAGCGSTEGNYVYYAGNRNIAMFYVEEGGAIICNDNH